MERTAEWDVTSTGRTVRVDLAAHDMTEADVDAIVAAAERLLSDSEVELVVFNGRGLDFGPPKSLARAIRALDSLAHRYDKPFLVGPI